MNDLWRMFSWYFDVDLTWPRKFLGPFHPIKSVPNPNSNTNSKSNPNPDRGGIFLGGNCPNTPIKA